MCLPPPLGPTKSAANDGGTLLRENAKGVAVESQTCYSAPSKAKGKAGLPKMTLQEVAKQSEAGRALLVIHSKVYDVTDYLARHPGGELVLSHLKGTDCTDAFENYHRAHVAQHLLPRFLIAQVPDAPPVPAHVQDFRALRQELLRRGLFEIQPAFYRNLKVWLASLLLGALYLTLATDSVACHLCGSVLMGLFWQQFAGYGHDLGHTSVTKHYHGDHEVASVFGCLLSGLSTAWWKGNHNTHHVVPNSVEHDPDIQHMPIMAVSAQVIEQPYWSTYYRKWVRLDRAATFLVSYQHLLFFPLMAVARFNLYAQSLILLCNPRTKSPYRWHELTSIAVFFTWYLAVALTLPTWTERVAWVVLAHAVSGLLHIQIVVSHWAMETYRKDDPVFQGKDALDWYTLQLRTTLDVECPAWFDWFHIGLQFQVIHHMFPTIPRSNLRVARALAREVCTKHGLDYHTLTFGGSIGSTWSMLAETAALARSGAYDTRNLLSEALNAEG
jgi:fatty acid desaturase/predicted heme/steroid binding protein